jgi:hypothetical protein
MAKRINVILPEATISTIDRLVKPGERSRLIDKAVRHYVATRSTEALREQFKQATIRDRDLDAETVDEWADVDRQLWQHNNQQGETQPASSTAANLYRGADLKLRHEIKKPDRCSSFKMDKPR